MPFLADRGHGSSGAHPCVDRNAPRPAKQERYSLFPARSGLQARTPAWRLQACSSIASPWTKNGVATSSQNSSFCFQTLSCRQRNRQRRNIGVSPSYISSNCGDEHLIRWNKSFDRTSVVYQAKVGGVCRAVECLPNQAGQCGQIEAVLCPFQREEADADSGDVLFLWQEMI